jgi:NADH:ubiquinone oxidoreductase subunit 2 (subunit N)
VLASVVSAGYYLPVIMAMYMRPAPFPRAHAGVRLGRLGGAALAVCIAAVLYFGVRPNRLLDLTQTSGAAIRPAAAAASPPPGN